MPGIRGPGDCEFCNGRGWFSVDMEGSAFYHCDACNTHKTVPGPFGTLVVEIKEDEEKEKESAK